MSRILLAFGYASAVAWLLVLTSAWIGSLVTQGTIHILLFEYNPWVWAFELFSFPFGIYVSVLAFRRALREWALK